MFTLDHIVPWGRSFDEYVSMFALSADDLGLRILGCADGPAAFNAEATRRGTAVVSCDPLYRYTTTQIQDRIAATFDEVLDQTRSNAEDFVWGAIRSAEELGRVRTEAMQIFLQDFDRGKADGRYVDAELPTLPFLDGAFDLALCSHFLFLYTTQLGEPFHRLAIQALCCVAREVRIFPLLALGGRPSPYVDGAVRACRDAGFAVSIDRVPYEFQRGGDHMMRIRATALKA